MDLDALKARLSDVPGIDTLTLTQISGRLVASFSGLIAAVDPSSTEDQLVAAIRKTAELRAVPEATPPAAPVQPQPQGKPMSITGAAPATLSIKQMIEASRQQVKAAHEKLATNAGKVAQAAAALDGLGDDLGAEADDLMAMIGQYKNDLG